MKRSHILPLLLWTLIWGLFFATLLLAVERLPAGDFAGQFHTFARFQAREMAAGRLPIWSPGSYAGIPFAADTQAAVFYPLRWLTVLVSLPSDFSFYLLELEGLLHIWLAGVFTYFLAYEITRDRSEYPHSAALPRSKPLAGLAAEQWAGLIAAVAFALGGYLTSYPLLQLAILETITWLPLVLYLLRRGIRPAPNGLPVEQSPVPALLAAGAFLGISALAGHPQTFLHVAYLSAAYFFFLTWQVRWRWPWVLGLGLMTGAVALGIAAAAFLPAMRFVPLTVREEVSYEFVSKGFPLLHVVQLLLPGYRTLWLPLYAGLVTLALACVAWFGRRHWPARGQRLETIFWLLVIGLAAWLALGDKGVLYELAYHVAPGLALFRQQERWLGLVALGIALLGAQGFVLWMRGNAYQQRRWLRRSGILLLFLLLLVGLIEFMSRSAVGRNDWFQIWIRQWLILSLVIGLLWPFGTGEKPRWDQWRGLALLLLLGLDLFFPVRRAMDLAPEPPAVFWPEPGWLDQLRGPELARIDGQNLFQANIGELHGLEDVKGISPLKPQLTADLEQLPRPLRWQLLNVRYVLAERQLEEGLIPVSDLDASLFPGQPVEAALYHFQDALPRAWLVYDAQVAAGDAEAFQLIRDPGFDPTQEVILTDPGRIDLESLSRPAQAPLVTVERWSSSELILQVDTETDGFLVISEWALPGWQATMDGMAAPLLTADYALQALFVPAGAHTITFTYTGQDVWLGLVVALATGIVAFILAWRWRPVVPRRPITAGTKRERRSSAGTRKRDSHMPARTKLWLMVGVLLLGFGLRAFLIGAQELRGDEAFSYLYSQLPVAEVLPELISEGDPHPPLHYLLLNIWVNLSGISELAMRWLSLLPGFLLLPVLYQLGRAMAGRKAGILAASLAAISPSLIWLAQDVRNQYTLALLWTALATWLLVAISAPPVRRSRQRNIVLWGLYVLLVALAVYSHYYAIFALLAHGLFLWFAPGRRHSLVPWIASGLLAVLLFLPWLLASLAELLAAGQLSDPGDPELARYLLRVIRELILGAALGGRWTRWLVLGVSGLVLVGLFSLRRKKPGWTALLGGWLGGALLLIYLVQFSRSTFNTFYISVAAPAWSLLLAAGLLRLWQRGSWRRAVALTAAVVMLAFTIASLRVTYFDPFFSRTLGYRQVARTLQEEGAEGDIFIAHFPDPALDYYLREVPMPRQMVPVRAGQDTAAIQNTLAEAAAAHERLWLVPYDNSVWDPDNVVPNWLACENVREEQVELQRLRLEAYRPLTSAAQIMVPIGQTVSEQIRLDRALAAVDGQAVDAGQPVALHAGAQLEVTLLWTALRDDLESYTVFVHLLDDNGALVAQHDGLPAQGRRPTSTWQVGEQVIDVHRLLVPEGVLGSGRIVAGLYDTETVERQLFANGADVIELAEVWFE